MQPLSKEALLERLLRGIEAAGWRFQVNGQQHPFEIVLFNEESRHKLLVYIWNITHGGGAARPADEYRIQLTGVTPPLRVLPGTETLLLGWSEQWTLFAAYDIARHLRFSAASPSIQFRKNVIPQALASGMGLFRRTNGEVVVVFRPELLVAYVETRRHLHTGAARTVARRQREISCIAETIDGGTAVRPEDAGIETHDPVIVNVTRKLREHSFTPRVKRAYAHACAACGLQFDVLDAAHIIPASVEHNYSTRNGLCLCPNHHRAYDSGLMVIRDDYRIVVERERIAYYDRIHRNIGREWLLNCLFKNLRIPSNPLEQPAPNLLARRLTLAQQVSS